MDDLTGKKTGDGDSKSHSAFNRRGTGDQGESGEQIPSQPRSFQPGPVRRKLADGPKSAPPGDKPKPDAKPAASKTQTPPPTAAKPADIKPALKSEGTKPVDAPAEKPAGAKSDEKSAAPSTGEPEKYAGAPAPKPDKPSSSGDTIRLRVSPRAQSRGLNTAPGRGIRRRLPDIRQGRAASQTLHYGPFSLLFGFFWLIFKMIFFTLLVFGLGALVGFMAMTEYIKTPEVTVPDVTGMKIQEAFESLSEKKLGVIKLRTESSALVAPDEIVSQQPPAGQMAKEGTDVGVVISSGRSEYIVPDVVNETEDNAIVKIRGARMEVGSVLTLEHPTVPRGKVISQAPIGKTGTDAPVKVNLMVSAGPPGKSLTMPDLAGKTVLEARAGLGAVGIENVVTEPANAAVDAIVQSHTPLVGKTVWPSDTVVLRTR